MTLPAKEQGETLLIQIQEAVCIDHQKLEIFAEILCKITTTAKIGNNIMKQYSKYYTVSIIMLTCNYCFIGQVYCIGDDIKNGKN